MFNTSKGITTSVRYKMCLLPPQQENKAAPILEKPPVAYDAGDGAVKLHTIKLSGACFSEVFTEKTQFKFMVVTK